MWPVCVLRCVKFSRVIEACFYLDEMLEVKEFLLNTFCECCAKDSVKCLKLYAVVVV